MTVCHPTATEADAAPARSPAGPRDAARVNDRSAAEETAGSAPTGQPPGDEGVGGGPLRPSEKDTYETEATEDAETVSAPPSSRPGIVVGLVVLAIFLAILAWAVVTALR